MAPTGNGDFAMDEVASGYGLVEAPVWAPGRGLFFSDVLGGGVFRLGLDGTVSPVVPKRRGVGGMALHAAGGLVVGGRNIAWVGDDGETRVLLDPGVIEGAIGFNDLPPMRPAASMSGRSATASSPIRRSLASCM
jgi:gluconolactonase